jgi:hypothetical protein
VLFLANLVFILASLFFMFSEGLAALRHKPINFRIRFLEPSQKIFFWFLLANIWLTSILQTLLDHGDNPRFLVPLQSFVVLWVALFFLQVARRKLPQPVHERQT